MKTIVIDAFLDSQDPLPNPYYEFGVTLANSIRDDLLRHFGGIITKLVVGFQLLKRGRGEDQLRVLIECAMLLPDGGNGIKHVIRDSYDYDFHTDTPRQHELRNSGKADTAAGQFVLEFCEQLKARAEKIQTEMSRLLWKIEVEKTGMPV